MAMIDEYNMWVRREMYEQEAELRKQKALAQMQYAKNPFEQLLGEKSTASLADVKKEEKPNLLLLLTEEIQ